MTFAKATLRFVRFALALSSLSLGCQLILGIEDRSVETSAECQRYCDAVMTTCTGTTSVYESSEACLATCAALDAGDPSAPQGTNTVACRTQAAMSAAAPAEAEADCPIAGPGGGPDGECGPECESYCRLLTTICYEETVDASITLDECLRQCPALRRANRFNVGNFQTGDTLECRINRVVAAATDRNQCLDAMIAPKNPSQPCTDPATGTPNCEDYCRVTQVACTGEFAVYDDEAQCMKACAALPPGSNEDSGGKTREVTEHNTIGCRKFHAYSSLVRPHGHCPHAGPTGQGYCGDPNESICESYCAIARAACPSDYATHFSDDDTACQAECRNLEGSAEADELDYTLAGADATGAAVNCRMAHATRAFAAPEAECPAALGQAAPCQ